MIVSVVKGTDGGRAELADRECHRAEQLAGVVVCSLNAFLFGNTVFSCVNEILSRALYSHNGEKTKSNCELVAVGVAKISVYSAANVLGNILAKTAAFDLRGAYYL